MSAQYENHFTKILAFLCSNGDTAVLPVDTIGYSASDNTLRIHDGCTRGGRYKLSLKPRCVVKTETPVKEEKTSTATKAASGKVAIKTNSVRLKQIK